MQLNKQEIEILKAGLIQAGYTLSPADHAWWRASQDGRHITAYRSGKVLIQSSPALRPGLDKLIQDCLVSAPTPQGSLLGLDESGKGDYFGPLVLAAALVPAQQHPELRQMGITDSKKMDDSLIRQVYPSMASRIRLFYRIILPEEYNRLYAQYSNLNLLLVNQYILLLQTPDPAQIDKAILDKFSQSEQQNRTLQQAVRYPLEITEKGERFACVAAASVAARYWFLDWFDHQERDLPRGSGPLARKQFEYLRDHDPDLFQSLAKAHFLQGRAG